jgi:glycosyltransferase involved in cell wall biosynthesis
MCLESVCGLDYPPDRYEIIVVEDGTESGEVIVAQAPKSPVSIRYVRIPHSGPAAARDVGLAHSRGDIVAYIDDDGLAAQDWLTQHVYTLCQNGATGSGGRISPSYPERTLQSEVLPNGDLRWTGSNADVPGFPEVHQIPGGNMAFWRKPLLEIGGFDAAFSKRGVWREDTDVCVRLIARGNRLLNNSKALVEHRAARWADPIDRVRFGVVWAMTRDDAYFRAKNFSWRGIRGAMRAAARDSWKRIAIGLANLLLVFAHLTAWIPGAWQGLRKKDGHLGTLDSQ